MIRWSFLLLFTAAFTSAFTSAQDSKYTVKVAKSEPPREASEAIRKLLTSESLVFMEQGKPIAEIWLRGEVPVEATEAQLKNGVTYREIKQTELIGVIKFPQKYYDYRKQNIKAGVYTLRVVLQPQDGDHAGKSPFLEFVIATAADKDTRAEPFKELKPLFEMSSKSIDTGHGAVFMLFPTKPSAGAKVEAKPNMHWALSTQREVAVKGKKTGSFLGISLTLVGHAEE